MAAPVVGVVVEVVGVRSDAIDEGSCGRQTLILQALGSEGTTVPTTQFAK
jgi:hypothetical protein